MKTNENPFSIGLWFAWSGKQVRYIIILAYIKVCTARQVLLMVFDMADIIYMVRPTRAVTEYVSLNVVPFLENQVTSTSCFVYSGAFRCNLGHIP